MLISISTEPRASHGVVSQKHITQTWPAAATDEDSSMATGNTDDDRNQTPPEEQDQPDRKKHEEEKEEQLDETIEESFPASDPPATY